MYPERSVSDMPDPFHLGACIVSSIWLQQSELRHSRSQQNRSSNPLEAASPSSPLERKTPAGSSSPEPCLLFCDTFHPWVWVSTFGSGIHWRLSTEGQASRERAG